MITMQNMVFLDRHCVKCGEKIPQLVTYENKDGSLRIVHFWKDCLVCHNLLPGPTEKEIVESMYYIKI